MFAKLYDTKYGQVLVKRDGSPSDEKPEVRFYAEPAGLGVCSMALVYEDDDDGNKQADDVFAKVDKGVAEAMARKLLASIKDMTR